MLKQLYTEIRLLTSPAGMERTHQIFPTSLQGCPLGNPNTHEFNQFGYCQTEHLHGFSSHHATSMSHFHSLNNNGLESLSFMAPIPMQQPGIIKPDPRRFSDMERWNSDTNTLLQTPNEASHSQGFSPELQPTRRLLIPTTDTEAGLHKAIQDLTQFCTRAEQIPSTQEVDEHLTDKLICPIARLPASKGSGSRNGHEAYQCLWPRCHKVTLRKGNAVSHLLSHVQYKPYVCHECPRFPRFRYKHDLTRHIKSHLSYILV